MSILLVYVGGVGGGGQVPRYAEKLFVISEEKAQSKPMKTEYAWCHQVDVEGS